MKVMRIPVWVVAVALSCGAVCPGQEPAAPAVEFPVVMPKVELLDGDVFVFLGDSITHQCLYTQFVETYHYTRYPDRRIRFVNAGVGGDRAAQALSRFEQEVTAFHPSYVSILLGMNDGSYRSFDQGTFETYQRDMTTVLDRIAAIGAKAIPMHPTLFDARASRMKGPSKEPTTSLYNGVLAYYGAWLHDAACRRGLGFVDMHSPLCELTMEQRRADARFTLIGDAVHPGPDGQVVMAVAMLDDLFVHSQVSAITADPLPAGGRKVTAQGGMVTGAAPDGLSFTFLAEALPWVLPPEARAGYEWTDAGSRHSAETLAVRGLEPGNYELAIDDVVVGSFSNAQLAGGVEMQENEKTPQYQQALAVAGLNAQRNRGPVKAIRDLWLQRKLREFEILKSSAQHSGAGRANAEKLNADLSVWLEREFAPAVAAQQQAADALVEKIYAINRPQPHRYRIARTASSHDDGKTAP